MVFIEGVLPTQFEIVPPPTWVTKVPEDGRSFRMRTYAKPQNHCSRDRGVRLKVNPTSRSRRGNKR